MNEQVTFDQKPSGKSMLKRHGLLLIAVAALVLGVFFNGSAMLLSNIENLFGKYGPFPSTIINCTIALMCGLILPLALFLLGDHPQKVSLSKIFLFVSAGFLGVQLFCAFICGIFALGRTEYSGILNIISSVFGSDLLSGLVYAVRNLFGGWYRFFPNLCRILGNLSSCLSSLFFIAVNAACAFGFFKLGFPKKQ